ncbi:MAG TPA: T9SS type A sorting domain-containing protein [Ignavibacteriaceae bacterium]|nr:T9SS type A sorting domain-containing protein [Ignavibacteriaceae bacterium]
MKNFKSAFLALLIILYPGINHSQTVDEIYSRFTKIYHAFGGISLPYYLFTPGVQDQEKYPLILCLHGAGERGDDGSAVRHNSMAVVWARDSNQVRWPCFLIVPQCPLNGSWTSSNIVSNIYDLLDSVIFNSPVDTNRVYITGLSMGGNGTWDMIEKYPQKFAAAVPVCGWGDSSKVSLIKNLPIWNFHGALDNTVPVVNSRMMMAALENRGRNVVYTEEVSDSALADTLSKGAKLLYTEYPTGGHSIWDQTYNNPLLLPWVFSQVKTEPFTGTNITASDMIPEFKLEQNFPNPFNPSTTIPFRIYKRSFVSLKIYDLLGKEVWVLLNKDFPPGLYHFPFSISHFPLPSGVYFYMIEAGGFAQTKKLIVLK